jgi:hypothetical protein
VLCSKSRHIAEVLARLRADVCDAFGVTEKGPRVNQGACGPFANVFVQVWNQHFGESAHVCFLVAVEDPDYCYHCLVRLPGGKFFDGGNGLLDRAELDALIARNIGPGRVVVEVMQIYDEELFDRRAYGRIKSNRPVGPRCPAYNEQRARDLIHRRLAELVSCHLAPRSTEPTDGRVVG